jgi:hypothetical protein
MTAVLGLAVATSFVVLDLPLNRLFLLIEYRQWIFQPELGPYVVFFDPSRMLQSDLMNIASSRTTSLFLATVFGKTCGYDATCHNVIHLSMIVSTGVLAAIVVRQLSASRSWLPAVVTAAFFLLSVPVFDALSWQATLLDKTAALLCSCTLLLASLVSVGGTRLPHIVVANLGFLLLAVAAYNAKEAALFMMPAVVLLLLVRSFQASGSLLKSVQTTLRLSVVALLYSVFHVAVVAVNRFVLSPGELSRVTGGNMAFNLEYYTRYLLNMMGSYTLFQLALGVATVAFVATVALACCARSRNLSPGWLVMWSLVGFLGSFVIPLRTSATAPFYLLVPLLFLAIFIGLVLEALLVSVRSQIAQASVMLLGFAIIGSHALALRAVYPGFLESVELSDNFRLALSKTSEELSRARPSRLIFVRPTDQPRAYMFLSNPGEMARHMLAPYLLPRNAPLSDIIALDDAIVDTASDALQPLKAGDLRIALDSRLRFVGLENGPR